MCYSTRVDSHPPPVLQETRLLLEDMDVREVLKLSSPLSSCFIILEHSVVYVTRCSDMEEHCHQGKFYVWMTV